MLKRTKKTGEKRTYSMKGAIPTWVSLVGRGANFTPLAQLKYAENEQFGQDVEINRIEFAKANFASKEAVETYLADNSYEGFEVSESDEVFFVASVDAEQFSEVSEIEVEDGVKYFVGKLKEATAEEAPAVEVVASEEFGVEPVADQPEETEEVSEETVQESQEEVSSEETEQSSEEATSEESPEGFTAEEVQEEVAEEAASEETVEYAQVSEVEALRADIAELKALFAEFVEKQNKVEETEETTIDETEIKVQNSHSVQTVQETPDTKQPDEKAVKFSQQRKNDLFGLR